MKDEFIVKGAMATCQFGVAPAMLSNIMDNMNVYFNGKLAATSMSLGPVFQAPAFGTCNMVPNMPKPCAAVITKWDNVFMGGMKINRISSPLTKDSKGTCALGCPMCISFTTTGQLPIPSVPLPEVVTVEHQSDMNPLAGNDESIARVQAKDSGDTTEIIEPKPFVVNPAKYDYFWGKVTSGSHNSNRSMQNAACLQKMGITNNAELDAVFFKAWNEGETVAKKTNPYGVTVVKKVQIDDKGAIEVGFFYEGGDISGTPKVTSMIPKITTK